MQVEFDPEVLDFETLLQMFWAGHDPTNRGRGSQYRAELYCADERQLALATESRDRLAEQLGAPVRTPLRIDAAFHAAEDYHQKWRLRRHTELWDELRTQYASEAALLASTAAAKLNGYVSGGAPREQVERDLPLLGVSEQIGASLIAAVRRR